jgi:hypothetical protein
MLSKQMGSEHQQSPSTRGKAKERNPLEDHHITFPSIVDRDPHQCAQSNRTVYHIAPNRRATLGVQVHAAILWDSILAAENLPRVPRNAGSWKQRDDLFYAASRLALRFGIRKPIQYARVGDREANAEVVPRVVVQMFSARWLRDRATIPRTLRCLVRFR